jgi:hypothetical protein
VLSDAASKARADGQSREIDQLLSSYSPEMTLGTSAGELARAHTWRFSRPYDNEASGITILPHPVFGVVAVRAYFAAHDSSVRTTDRVIGYIMGSDTPDAARAATLIKPGGRP